MGETEARERSRFSNFGGPTHGLPHLFHYLGRERKRRAGGAQFPLCWQKKNWDEAVGGGQKKEEGGWREKSEKIEK